MTTARAVRLAVGAFVLIAGILPSMAAAWVSGNLSPTTFGPLKVAVYDDAYDGCWTNLGEAKTYAEDRLRNLGYIISDDVRFHEVAISVNTKRYVNGLCYGSIDIQIFSSEVVNGIYGNFEVAYSKATFIVPGNINQEALNQIRMMTDEMRAAQR
jgi:hypothetical protein